MASNLSNKAARWDYQRDTIYIRSDSKFKRAKRKGTRRAKRTIRVQAGSGSQVSAYPIDLRPATAAEAAWNKRVDIALMTCRAMNAGQLQRS